MRKKLFITLPIIAVLTIILAVLLFVNPTRHTHNYSDKEVTVEPTCATAGEVVYTCSCGDVKKVTIPVIDHNWTKDVITEPTCEAEGEMRLTCECGETKSEVIPATHKWDHILCGEKQICQTCRFEQINPDTHSLDKETQKCKICGVDSIRININATPITADEYNENNEVVSSFTITKVDYTYNSGTVTMLLDGIKSYDFKSDDRLSVCKMTYKLSDKDGYTIATGTVSSIVKLAVNDDVRGLEIKINNLAEFEEYTLEFRDYRI